MNLSLWKEVSLSPTWKVNTGQDRSLCFAEICIRPTKLELHKIQEQAELNHSSRTCCVATATESHQTTCPVPAPYVTAGLSFLLQSVTWVGGVVITLAEGLAGSGSILKQPEDMKIKNKQHTIRVVHCLIAVLKLKVHIVIVKAAPHIRKLWGMCVVCKAAYLGTLWLFGQPPPLPGWQQRGFFKLWGMRHWKGIA